MNENKKYSSVFLKKVPTSTYKKLKLLCLEREIEMGALVAELIEKEAKKI